MAAQKRNIAQLLFLALVGGIFAFSLYVFFTTENTVIVINETAAEPKELFVAPPASEIEEPEPNPQLRILETGVGFLNVRDGASLQAEKIGRVQPGEVYEYREVQNGWYRIVHPELQDAWVSGQYVKEVVEQEN